MLLTRGSRALTGLTDKPQDTHDVEARVPIEALDVLNVLAGYGVLRQSLLCRGPWQDRRALCGVEQNPLFDVNARVGRIVLGVQLHLAELEDAASLELCFDLLEFSGGALH